LQTNRAVLTRCAQALLQQETLDTQALQALTHDLIKTPATVLVSA